MESLVKQEHTQALELSARLDRISDLMESSKSPATRKAYRRDWDTFLAWCAQEGVQPMPAHPISLVLFLDTLRQEGKKSSTIRRALAAVAHAHKLQGHASPAKDWKVLEALKGLERKEFDAGIQPDRARALLREDLSRMLSTLDPSKLLDIRNRALLLVGWAGAFRRSELCQMNVEHIDWSPRGLVVTIPRSKTDQLGKEKRVKAVPNDLGKGLPSTSAVVQEWVEKAGIQTGPVFRGMDRHGNTRESRLTPRIVSDVLTSLAKAANIDVDGLSAHSLRAGWVTQARLDGLQDAAIIAQAGWKTGAMLSTYTRPETTHFFDAMEKAFSAR